MKASALLEKVLPRITTLPDNSGLTFIEALNKVIDIFFDRFHAMRSNVVLEPIEGVSVTTEFVDLPDDFRGFEGTIYLTDSSDNRSSLKEMPTEQYGATGGAEPPPYYRLVGPFRMQFGNPPTDDSGEYDDTYTLTGFYYSHPGTLELIDYLPWDELYDMEIEEGVLIAIAFGTADESVKDKIGDLVMRKSSNRVVTPRRNKAWV